MPSRFDARPISVTTPTIKKVKEMKARLKERSYESLINHLIDNYQGVKGDNDAQ